MAKLKLPFELEKPSADEYVTQASEVGSNGQSVEHLLGKSAYAEESTAISLIPTSEASNIYVAKNTAGTSVITLGRSSNEHRRAYFFEIEKDAHYEIVVPRTSTTSSRVVCYANSTVSGELTENTNITGLNLDNSGTDDDVEFTLTIDSALDYPYIVVAFDDSTSEYPTVQKIVEQEYTILKSKDGQKTYYPKTFLDYVFDKNSGDSASEIIGELANEVNSLMGGDVITDLTPTSEANTLYIAKNTVGTSKITLGRAASEHRRAYFFAIEEGAHYEIIVPRTSTTSSRVVCYANSTVSGELTQNTDITGLNLDNVATDDNIEFTLSITSALNYPYIVVAFDDSTGKYPTVQKVVAKEPITEIVEQNTEDIEEISKTLEDNESLFETEKHNGTLYTSAYFALATGLGRTVELVENQSSIYNCWKLEVHTGDVVTIKTRHTNQGSARSYGICNKNMVLVKKGWAEDGVYQDLITNPVTETIAQDGYVVMNLSGAYASDIAKCELSYTKSVIDERITALENPIDNLYLEKINDNPLSVIQRGQTFVAAIKRWGIIGSSYDSGNYEDIDEHGNVRSTDDFTYAWGQIMGRLNDTSVTNFSMGGATAKAWCQTTGSWGWGNGTVGASATANLQQAYVVDLGGNDASSGIAVGDLETDVDLSDYNNNADTYAGWIAGVIQRLRSVNPRCYIFVCTMYRYNKSDSANTAYDNIVRALPAFFGSRVYLLDQRRYQVGADVRDILNTGGHPNPIGHTYLAWQFNTFLDWIIRRNFADFKEVRFVLDYDGNGNVIGPGTHHRL